MNEVSGSYAPYLFLNDHIFMQRIAIDEIIIFHKIRIGICDMKKHILL